jgi:hypothetical protein
MAGFDLKPVLLSNDARLEKENPIARRIGHRIISYRNSSLKSKGAKQTQSYIDGESTSNKIPLPSAHNSFLAIKNKDPAPVSQPVTLLTHNPIRFVNGTLVAVFKRLVLCQAELMFLPLQRSVIKCNPISHLQIINPSLMYVHIIYLS